MDADLARWSSQYDTLRANYERGKWRESFGEQGQVYETPYGRRVVDNDPANEIKTGYQSRTKFIRWQVLKDSWLSRNVPGYKPQWDFVDQKPSNPLMEHLETFGIPYRLPAEIRASAPTR